MFSSTSSKSLSCNSTHVEEEGEQDELYIHAALLTMAMSVPMALKATIELNLLDIMTENGPSSAMSIEEIVSKLPTSNPQAAETLEQILQFLVCHEVFTCSVNDDGIRRYGLTSLYRLLAKNDGPFAGVLLFSHSKVIDSWLYLKNAVLEGAVPFNKAFGLDFFAYHKKEPALHRMFNNAMSCQTKALHNKMLSVYKGFEEIKVLVDVGGGLGSSLDLIITKYPNIRGINFDLPAVISEAPSIRGVEHVGGDMFRGVPKGDAIFMKHILHNWSDDHCVAILRNCWESLPNSGKVIIVDGILPEVADKSGMACIKFFINLLMLTYLGGKVRTKKQFESLAQKAGFSQVKVACHVREKSIIEFYK